MTPRVAVGTLHWVMCAVFRGCTGTALVLSGEVTALADCIDWFFFAGQEEMTILQALLALGSACSLFVVGYLEQQSSYQYSSIQDFRLVFLRGDAEDYRRGWSIRIICEPSWVANYFYTHVEVLYLFLEGRYW